MLVVFEETSISSFKDDILIIGLTIITVRLLCRATQYIGTSQERCVKVARNHRLPCRVRPLRRLPALSLLPGQTVAHDAK